MSQTVLPDYVLPALDRKSVKNVEEIKVFVVETAEGIQLAVCSSQDEPSFRAVFSAAAMLTNTAARVSPEGFERTLDLIQTAAMRRITR